MFSQSCLGFWLAEVIISTWSPLCNSWRSVTTLLLMRAPTHELPIFEWMW